MAVLSTVAIVPSEELFFRYVLQRRLEAGLGTVVAISLTSIVFAGMHLPSYIGAEPLVMVILGGAVFLNSVVLGAVYYWTRTLLVVIGMHALYNLVQFGILALP